MQSIVGLLLAILICGAATGAEDLSRIRCEDKDFIQQLTDNLKSSGRHEDGTRVGSYWSNSMEQSLVCKLKIRDADGTRVWGQLVVHQLGNGQLSARLVPY